RRRGDRIKDGNEQDSCPGQASLSEREPGPRHHTDNTNNIALRKSLSGSRVLLRFAALARDTGNCYFVSSARSPPFVTSQAKRKIGKSSPGWSSSAVSCGRR